MTPRKLLYHLRHTAPRLLFRQVRDRLVPASRVPPRGAAAYRKACLIVGGWPGAAFRYRCHHQAEQLRRAGMTVDVADVARVDFDRVLGRYDCFWLQRVASSPAVERLVAGARARGAAVVFDSDDLVFDERRVPYIRSLAWMSAGEVARYYDGVRLRHRTLGLCDYTTVSTVRLMHAVSELFPHVRCYVTANAVSEMQVVQARDAMATPRPAADRDVVRLAYLSGTRTHDVDFLQCAEAVAHLLAEDDRVRLLVVGHLDLGEEFRAFGRRVERRRLVPWEDLPRLLRWVDVNLAPLEPGNPFTEAKSDVKYLEAALLGIPTVASAVGQFRASLRPGDNGYLCATVAEWTGALRRLVEDAPHRREVGARARSEVLRTRTTAAAAPVLAAVIREITRRARSEAVVPGIAR